MSYISKQEIQSYQIYSENPWKKERIGRWFEPNQAGNPPEISIYKDKEKNRDLQDTEDLIFKSKRAKMQRHAFHL